MRSVEVQILGQFYSIKTDEDESYVREVARYVDEKLKEIYTISPTVNNVKAAIMVALGITDELFKLRMEREDLDRMIDEKTEIISGLLD